MFDLFDAHSDTFVKAMRNKEDIYDGNLHINIKKMEKFDSVVQVFAMCIANEKNDSPYNWYKENLNYYKENMEKYKEYISPVNLFSDIKKIKEEGKIASILAIEGAEVLEGSMDNLHEAYELGVRLINPTWNNNNELGHSSMADVNDGLTKTGKDFVKEMNSLGIIIDVSHLSIDGFWDIYEISEKPFIASHSNAYKITEHPRNLNDDQLKALKDKGGVTGLNLCAPFLEASGKPQMDDVIRHLEHMIKYAGENGVGLGCDFDGIGDPEFELTDISKMDILYDRCIKEFGKDLTRKIFYDNFYNVFGKIMK